MSNGRKLKHITRIFHGALRKAKFRPLLGSAVCIMRFAKRIAVSFHFWNWLQIVPFCVLLDKSTVEDHHQEHQQQNNENN